MNWIFELMIAGIAGNHREIYLVLCDQLKAYIMYLTLSGLIILSEFSKICYNMGYQQSHDYFSI